MVLLIKITEAWKQSKYRDPAWCLRRRHPATQKGVEAFITKRNRVWCTGNYGIHNIV